MMIIIRKNKNSIEKINIFQIEDQLISNQFKIKNLKKLNLNKDRCIKISIMVKIMRKN